MNFLLIQWPFLGMMVLTFVVWVTLYRRRIAYMRAERIHPQRVSTPEKGRQLIPDHVNYPANNYNHLFELPVLFYALVLFLIATGMDDRIDAALAWGFFLGRCAHSFEQCTTNIVMRRFILFIISSLFVWALLFRTLVRLHL
ncbi:MAG: MAPEG family protein [Pseudomonadota bacterium]